MTSPSPPCTPELSDEIIAAIFDHFTPNRYLAKDKDINALKAACLVSRRFGYYGRHGLYPSIEVMSLRSAIHYLQLCRRHPDMGYHIKRFNIAGGEDAWHTQNGANTLSALLDFLAQKGFVRNIRLIFELPWDKYLPNLQASLVKLIVTRPLHVLELGNICDCFPFELLPIPWLCKRLTISRLVDKSSDPGTRSGICSQQGTSAEVVKISHSFEQRSQRSSTATLNSLWIEGYAVRNIASLSIYPGSTRLAEISCHGVSDQALPSIIDLLSANSKTIESIIFSMMYFSTSNSPDLYRFANLDLPRLTSLTIVACIDKIFDGLRANSVAWVLLHMNHSRKLRPKVLNILFAQPPRRLPNAPLNPVFAAFPQHHFIDGVFQFLGLFNFDAVISGVLHSEGVASIWFLFADIPTNYHKLVIDRRMETNFPVLHRERRIQGFVGTTAESSKLMDALSISPKEPFISTYDATKHLGPSEAELCEKYPELRPEQQ